MKIGVLGTGNVGHTIGSKMIELGHQVMMGSRSLDNEKAKAFKEKHGSKTELGTFESCALFGEILFNCTSGMGSLNALQLAGEKALDGKVLIDLANPLDTSNGMPPTLQPVNTDSLGESIQRAFPNTKVVKALNTIWCGLMVNPSLVNGGDHSTFICGNDAEAKDKVKSLLVQIGWMEKNIIDLGDISQARGTEMYLPLWLRLYGQVKSPAFNIKLVTNS